MTDERFDRSSLPIKGTGGDSEDQLETQPFSKSQGKMRPQTAKNAKQGPDTSLSYQRVAPWVPANYSLVASTNKTGTRPVTAGSRKRTSSANREKSSIMNSSMSRHIPKNIAHDKEDMYDETIRLKKDMNACKGENTKLKTQIQQYENNLTKKDNYIRELLNQINAQQGSTDNIKKVQKIKVDTHLVAALKKKIKELNNSNKAKNDEMELMKRKLKSTKIREIEAETQVYIEESARLRQMLEDLMSKGSGTSSQPVVDNNSKQQNEILKKIKQENSELVGALHKKEEDLTSWKEKAKKLEKQLQSQEKELAKNKKTGDNQKEIEKIKEEYGKKNAKLEEEAAKIVNQCEELQKINNDLSKAIKQKDKSIEGLEEKYNEAVKHQSAKKAYETELGLLRGKLKDYEQEVEKLKKSQKEKIVPKKIPIVGAAEINLILTELRLFLINSMIPNKNLKMGLFDVYDPQDKLSIHEISRLLQRKLKNNVIEDNIKLARFIIEPRSSPELIYNELAEEKLGVIIEKLVELIHDYTLFTEQNEMKVKTSLAKKLETKLFGLQQTLQSIETAPDIISWESIEQIAKILNIQLTLEEQDYLTLIMYKESKDIKKLPYQVLLKKLEEFGCKPISQPDANKEEDEEIDRNIDLALKGEGIIEENVNRKVEPPMKQAKKKQLVKSNSDPRNIGEPEDDFEEEPANKNEEIMHQKGINKGGEDVEAEDIDEAHMIEIAQKCFFTIAERMTEKKMTANTLYSNKITKKTIEGEEIELLTPTDFINGLQVLGMEDISPLESACLIRVLAINDQEEFIRFNDLAQILEDYGIVEEESEEDQGEGKGSGQFLKFEMLDNISMVLMLALTEYLIQAKVPLYQLLGNAIYKQGVKTKARQKSIDLINSKDFFAVLEQIGVKLEEDEHENLKDFLCLDPKFKDRLYVKKIKKAIEEFAFNEELRSFARKCYAELAEEDKEGEDEEDKTAANEEEEKFVGNQNMGADLVIPPRKTEQKGAPIMENDDNIEDMLAQNPDNEEEEEDNENGMNTL